METVGYAKRMVDENRLLKEKLKRTDDQIAEIKSLRSENDGLQDTIKKLKTELEETKLKNKEQEGDISKFEMLIERLKTMLRMPKNAENEPSQICLLKLLISLRLKKIFNL